MKYRRVVITGIGLVTPLGHSFEEFTDKLMSGYSAAGIISNFDSSKFKARVACEIKDFDAKSLIERKTLRAMDRFSQFAMVAADRAFENSGINIEEINDARSGVIVASGIGGIKTFEDEIKNFVSGDGTPKFNPFFIPKMIIDLASGLISIKYGLRGVNYSTVSACASSSNAIGSAYEYIRYGRADLMVTGGAEASISESSVGGFSSMKAISERNDDPKTASRPFDVDRDGFVMGEGSVIFILEELEKAKARGAHIYAEIVGSGYSADAHHITAPHPEGLGAKLVMNNALEDAGINPTDIDYVNVHGTSTPLGDISEIKAILDVFGEHAYKLNISSTKSMHGHLLGSAGAIESAAVVAAIRNSKIPPTINLFNLDPQIDSKLNLTPNKAQEREVNYAINNTFGFGGHNACLVFKKYN